MPEDKHHNSLTRIYEKFEADIHQRRPIEPKKRTAFVPLIVIITILFTAVIFGEYTRYQLEKECEELRSKAAEMEATIKAKEEKAAAIPVLKKEIPGAITTRQRSVKNNKRQNKQQNQLRAKDGGQRMN